MKKYLAPLGVFCGGQLMLLIVFLFLPAVGTAGTKLAADTAAIGNNFWGWTWVVSSVKLWVWLAFELAVLYATALAFIHNRT